MEQIPVLLVVPCLVINRGFVGVSWAGQRHGLRRPLGVAVSPDGTRAYVTNFSANTVSVIKTNTNTVVATIPVGAFPFGVAVSPNGTRAYVTNLNDDTASVINTNTNTVVATIPVGDLPFGVAIGVVPCPGHGKPGHGKPGHDRPTTATTALADGRVPANACVDACTTLWNAYGQLG